MSRKTKAEKRITETRRRSKLLEQLTKPESYTLNPKISVQKHKEMPDNQTNIQPEDTRRIKFFIQDLRKSLILIFLIITLEIVFYFATMNGYFENLLKF